jgi:fructose-1,6-bisphosphatase/sedoheptulose 1,7-bisphosphatase-like protein
LWEEYLQERCHLLDSVKNERILKSKMEGMDLMEMLHLNCIEQGKDVICKNTDISSVDLMRGVSFNSIFQSIGFSIELK